MTGNEFPARARCLRPEQYALAQQQRIKAERIGLELTRALATAVDAELRSSMSVVQRSLPVSPRDPAPGRVVTARGRVPREGRHPGRVAPGSSG